MQLAAVVGGLSCRTLRKTWQLDVWRLVCQLVLGTALMALVQVCGVWGVRLHLGHGTTLMAMV